MNPSNHCHRPDPASHSHSHDQGHGTQATPGPGPAQHDTPTTRGQVGRDRQGDSCCTPAPLLQADAGTAGAMDAGVRSAIRILQMDCPTEETLIRGKLQAMPAVHAMEFNLVQRTLTVAHRSDAREPILAAIRALGFDPQLVATDAPRPATTAAAHPPWLPLALAGVAALAAEAAHWTGQPPWIAAALAVAAIAVCGLGTYQKGFIALRNGHLNINALMSIAVTGALLLGQWPEAAMVMVLFTLAERIEARSLDRARDAIQGLLRLAPEQATVLQPGGAWQVVAADSVARGALVRVRPGERIALDGHVESGQTSIDQSPITGESLPVDKAAGDAVFAGTINGAGGFEYRVSAAAGDTLLSRIVRAVEQAQGNKAPTQRFVDRFARVYTPVVVVLALLVAVVPPLLLQGAWWDWIYKALVLLVIACPCALVISTPVTIVSGLAAAARKGILVKGGAFLEQGRRLDWLALDKTGTLTQGTPVQKGFEAAPRPDGGAPAHASPSAPADTLLQHRRLAASLAGRSDHPVSQAIARAATADGIDTLPVTAFEALPGHGVRGVIDGQHFVLGNHRWVHDRGHCSPELEQRLDALERQGTTVVMLLDSRRVLALFAVADTVKRGSRAAIAELHALGIRTLMLTGDNRHAAQSVAADVGITEVRGNQLPHDKLAAVAALADGGHVVGMVGDGINDAPALARADIGFAMGALGTDTAIATADVALMDDDLHKLAVFVRLSRATHRILVQNIALALGIKAVFLVLTVAGMGTMWMAVFADVGASLLVVGNGLRILRR